MLAWSEMVFRQAFAQSSGASLILTPDLRVVAVNKAFLRTAGSVTEDIVGEYLFDLFPGSPDDPDDNGRAMLHASPSKVRAELRPHRMGVQRYDVRDKEGRSRRRHWLSVNPCAEQDGRAIALIHSVVEVQSKPRVWRAANGSATLRYDPAVLVDDTRRVTHELLDDRPRLLDEAVNLAADAESLLTRHRQG